MTERVDFYILKSLNPRDRRMVACRVTEKAYLQEHRVLILNEDMAEAQALDDLLWTFNERAFVPHQICVERGSADPNTPVNLVLDLETAPETDVLVNLSSRLPAPLQRFARIAEIVDGDEQRRRLGRERFKSYRDLGVSLETHQLDDGGLA
jgi:DNA polymerase III subunit chi